MSNFQALGGVSESLRALLLDRMEVPLDAVANFRVSIGPPRPDSQIMTDAAENPRINLFLYRVDENAGLKNQHIPGKGNPGDPGTVPLSLDLHYLVTAYGTREQQGRFDETLAQFLLGSAMRVLHDFPIVTDGLVTVRPPLGIQVLHTSLRGEFEKIKTSLEPVSLEDISKIWTALTLPFRVSAAYAVNVVQIESQRGQRFPRRVQPEPGGGARIIVVPFRHPRIEELQVHWQSDPAGVIRKTPYASIGDTVILLGENLASENTRVRIGQLEIPLGQTFDNQRLEFTVPDATLPGGITIPDAQRLQPGVHTVEVVAGVPELAQTGFPSNQVAFMLTPRVTTAVAALAVAPRTVTITGTRLFHPRLSGETLIGRAVIPKELYTTPTQTQITAPIPDTLPGYRIRALVSGALGAPPATLANSSMDVTIGGDGPHAVTFPRNPDSFPDLAALTERAFRSAPNAGGGFAGARVGITSGNRLVVVPGGVRDTILVAGGGPADDLLLTIVLGAASMETYQSGRLPDTPILTAAAPAMNFTLGVTTATVNLPPRPPSLAVAGQNLEAGIIAANAAFAAVRVAVAGNQLIVMGGAATPIAFAPVPGGDQITIAELDMAETALLRVRVNGAESLTDNPVDLTV